MSWTIAYLRFRISVHWVMIEDKAFPSTYGHSQLKTGHPVRSAIHKQLNGRLVLRWVTTWESLLLYVFLLHLGTFSHRLFACPPSSLSCVLIKNALFDSSSMSPRCILYKGCKRRCQMGNIHVGGARLSLVTGDRREIKRSSKNKGVL